jgi:von Willebrand factor type A domain-containing protein
MTRKNLNSKDIKPKGKKNTHLGLGIIIIIIGSFNLTIMMTGMGLIAHKMTLIGSSVDFSYDDLIHEENYDNNEEQIPERDTDALDQGFPEPKGLPLNASIKLNQSAYKPGSFVNLTLNLNNNYTQNLTNIQFQSKISTDITPTVGALNASFSDLEENATISSSIVFQLPHNASSLDVVFLIDGSGSMSSEINQIKTNVMTLVNQLLQNVSEVRIAFIFFGASLYSENPSDSRNILDFTSDSTSISNYLSPFSASGGWEPWGDALSIALHNLSWKSDVKLAILITDEPCNNGNIVGDYAESGSGYYDGPKLYDVVDEYKEAGIPINSLECNGGGSELHSQLISISEKTDGISITLESSASNLIDSALYVCQEAISEYGVKISTAFKATLNGNESITVNYKWVVIDNQPPSIIASCNPVYKYISNNSSNTSTIAVNYRMNCKIIDAAGVDQVMLYYKYNSTNYTSVLMNYSGAYTFTYLFPSLVEGSVIFYYFNLTDRLLNSEITDINWFTVKNTIQSLSLNSKIDFSLGSGEFMYYLIEKLTLSTDHLFIKSTGNSDIEFQDLSNSSSNSSLSVNLNISKSFEMLNLENFVGSGMVSIHNPSSNHFISVNVIRVSVTDYTIAAVTEYAIADVTDNTIAELKNYKPIISISNSSPVQLFRVNIAALDKPNLQCFLTAENEFQFFEITVFNSTSIIKSQIFNKIDAKINSTGIYYVMIGISDYRQESLYVSVQIKLGDPIDDTPYWDYSGDYVSTGMSVDGYSGVILLMVSIFSIVILKKKKKKKCIKNI